MNGVRLTTFHDPADDLDNRVECLRAWHEQAEPVAWQSFPSVGQWRSTIRLMREFKELHVDPVVLTADPVLGRNVTEVLQRFGRILHAIPPRKKNDLLRADYRSRGH